jgi:hypothetical protein
VFTVITVSWVHQSLIGLVYRELPVKVSQI